MESEVSENICTIIAYDGSYIILDKNMIFSNSV